MKKLYMTILICVTIGCVIGGTAMHAVGLAVRAGQLLSGRDGSSMTTRASASTTAADYDLDAFTALSLDVGMGDVTVLQGDEPHLTFTGAEALLPVLETDGGTLTIRQANRSLPEILSTDTLSTLGGSKNTLTITVPRDAGLLKLNASLDMGDFTISGITAQDAEIDLNMGDLDLQGCTFANLTVDSEMGNVTVKDVEAGQASFSDNMGNIGIDRLGGFTLLTLEADMGNIDAFLSWGLDDLTLDLSADLGSVYVNGEKTGSRAAQGSGACRVTAKASMGTIRITTP